MESLKFLEQSKAFSNVERPALNQIAESSCILSYPPRRVVYVANEPPESLCVLIRGRVALGHFTRQGKRSWLLFVDAGETFAEQSLLPWPRHEECAETFESSQILRISAHVIRDLLPLYPQLALATIRLLGERLKRTHHRWKTQFFRSTRERLAIILLELSKQYGRQTDQGIDISIELSHEDLAGFVGSTRETVSLEIGRLRKEGLIHSSRRHLTLYEPDRWESLISQ